MAPLVHARPVTNADGTISKIDVHVVVANHTAVGMPVKQYAPSVDEQRLYSRTHLKRRWAQLQQQIPKRPCDMHRGQGQAQVQA